MLDENITTNKDLPTIHSAPREKDIDGSVHSATKKKHHRRGKKRRQMSSTDLGKKIRYSPKAPENYTQYLISDQNDNFALNESGECDLSNFPNFLQAQFETDFKEARAAELSHKSKSELTQIINELEEKQNMLTNYFAECSDCSYVDSVQSVNAEENGEVSSSSSSSESESEGNPGTNEESLHMQLINLQRENDRLRSLNEQLTNS